MSWTCRIASCNFVVVVPFPVLYGRGGGQIVCVRLCEVDSVNVAVCCKTCATPLDSFSHVPRPVVVGAGWPATLAGCKFVLANKAPPPFFLAANKYAALCPTQMPRAKLTYVFGSSIRVMCRIARARPSWPASFEALRQHNTGQRRWRRPRRHLTGAPKLISAAR
jgi:hypothetical protein